MRRSSAPASRSRPSIDGNEGATDRDVLDIRMNGLTSLDLSSLSFVQWTSGHDLVQVLGGALSETVVGTAVFDTIDGGSGNDIITGGGGRDTLRGGSGGDTFLFKAGDAAAGEVIDGGLDRDAIEIGRGGVHDFRVADVLSIEQVTFGNGTPTTEAAFAIAQFGSAGIGLEAQVMGGIGGGQDILSLHLGGETRADLSGLGFVNWGTGDSVRIFGSSKDDTIIGSEVGDVIDGGLGSDTMAGGLGDDTYVVDDAGDEVFEAVNEGTDTVLTTLSSLTLSDNVENLTFTGAGAFDGIGNRRANTIIGGSDADTLQGLLGSDTLCGEAGNDQLIGGNGSDILIGGAGRDRLTGEAGFDSLHVRGRQRQRGRPARYHRGFPAGNRPGRRLRRRQLRLHRRCGLRGQRGIPDPVRPESGQRSHGDRRGRGWRRHHRLPGRTRRALHNPGHGLDFVVRTAIPVNGTAAIDELVINP